MKTNAAIVDTNVLIQSFNLVEKDFAIVERLVQEKSLYLSTINVAEITASPIVEYHTQLKYLVSLVEVIDVDLEIASLAGQLKRQRKLKKTKLYLADCLIAATAIVSDCVLITHNLQDFKFSKLRVISP